MDYKFFFYLISSSGGARIPKCCLRPREQKLLCKIKYKKRRHTVRHGILVVQEERSTPEEGAEHLKNVDGSLR